MSAEGIEPSASHSQRRSQALIGGSAPAQGVPEPLTETGPKCDLFAALSRAAAAAAEAGDVQHARQLHEAAGEALPDLVAAGPSPVRIVGSAC